MKLPGILLVFVLLAGCRVDQSCTEVTTGKSESPEQNSPLSGAWELVHAEYGLPDNPAEIDQADNPVQLKIFSDGHYAYVMNGPDGAFWGASAGTYVVDGDRYTETTRWSSTPENIGSKTTFMYRVEGNRLYMSGPLEIVDANGSREKNFQHMKEVRRRAGSQ